MSVSIGVFGGRGNNQQLVGEIEAREGIRTNRGRIARVTDSGVVYLEDGTRVNKPAKFLTVAKSDASRRRGFVEYATN